jgi:hypothetical protein
MGLGSGIRALRSGIRKKHIPVPGSGSRVKKAPEPGSGSSTLYFCIFFSADELASLSTRQKVNILLITPDAADSHSRGPELQKFLTNSDVYDITLTVRTPQKHEQAVIESASSVEEIDQQIGRINYLGNTNYR